MTDADKIDLLLDEFELIKAHNPSERVRAICNRAISGNPRPMPVLAELQRTKDGVRKFREWLAEFEFWNDETTIKRIDNKFNECFPMEQL